MCLIFDKGQFFLCLAVACLAVACLAVACLDVDCIVFTSIDLYR